MLFSKPALSKITDTYRCPPTPGQNGLRSFDAIPKHYSRCQLGRRWHVQDSCELQVPIERARFYFYITYEDLGGAQPGQTTCDEGVNRQDYAYSTFVFQEDLNPTDLNEDGVTNFGDLLIVISDVAGNKYADGGFDAILTVLSGWGPNQ